ncbi:unnamed protein product [Rotaria socialis]|uniref:Uncharacterized protein n=1 Tax=Rotaria socialis TaxID=392032 RepID=A0A817S7V1_9BILA|nr:unnamed protein product [Rotaria socialis]CAF4258393.1 unnamed protein product [Rotaria socialis]
MPFGHEFSVGGKVLIFTVTRFCEQEKAGPIIPLNNVVERISTLLGISERSVNRLKKEMHQLMEQEKQEIEKQEKQKREKENEHKYQLRSQTKSDSDLKNYQPFMILPRSKILHERKRHTESLTASIEEVSIPKPLSKKKGYSGGTKLFLAEYAKNTIRYSFYLLLEEKIYPTTARLLSRLRQDFDDFTIHSVRKRLAISALINTNGYHLNSVDIFLCSDEHSMDNDRFIKWISDTSLKLLVLRGENAKIVIVLDNEPWHNVLSPESTVPKRSWRKGQIQEWLIDHHVSFDCCSVRAELLELVLANAPPKEYMTDRVAEQFNAQIVRLPHRHCCLNPIELSWNNLNNICVTTILHSKRMMFITWS